MKCNCFNHILSIEEIPKDENEAVEFLVNNICKNEASYFIDGRYYCEKHIYLAMIEHYHYLMHVQKLKKEIQNKAQKIRQELQNENTVGIG